jgi:hypothetical protein
MVWVVMDVRGHKLTMEYGYSGGKNCSTWEKLFNPTDSVNILTRYLVAITRSDQTLSIPHPTSRIVNGLVRFEFLNRQRLRPFVILRPSSERRALVVLQDCHHHNLPLL